jgi:hypothetical protein
MPGKILSVLVLTLGLALIGLATRGDCHTTAYLTVRPVNTGQTYIPSLRLFRTPIVTTPEFERWRAHYEDQAPSQQTDFRHAQWDRDPC